MTTILDRYILRNFLVNYAIALLVMMSLYVLLDLFFNLDEFTENRPPLLQLITGIAGFYGNNLFLYYAQLSGVITLFAAVATLARMQYSNELTAVLGSGVSLYRVALPIIAATLLLNVAWVVDVEVIIPRIAPQLARRHDDITGQRLYQVWFLRDREGALLSAMSFQSQARRLRRMIVLKRDSSGQFEEAITADLAQWRLDSSVGGAWELERGISYRRASGRPGADAAPEQLLQESIDAYPSALPPDDVLLRQSSQWIDYLSQRELSRLLREKTAGGAHIAEVKHNRFTTPFFNMVLLLLGLPFFLNREPRKVIRNGARCLLVCGICFLAGFVSQNMVKDLPYEGLAAWLPVIVFAPVAALLMDRVRT